jgi:hypothetical protein
MRIRQLRFFTPHSHFFGFYFRTEPISKIADHVQEQGVSRRKSAAYMKVCEHFKAAHNKAIGR